MKPCLPAGNIPVRNWARLLFISAALVVLASGLMILCDFRPLPLFWFDDIHWTFAYLSAAGLAWIGVRTASADELSARRWFAFGLTANAVGHVVWNLQVAMDRNPFPALSDLLFLCLGPSLAMGFWAQLRSRVNRSDLRVAALDAGALSAAALALTLALYLPRQGEMTAWAMAVLVAYPATLLSAASLGIILVLTLRPRANRGWLILLLALVGTGSTWMRWNLLGLEQAIDYGGWLNLSFSACTLGLGWGAMRWRAESSSNPRWENFCEGLLRLLPMLLVIAAAISLAVVLGLPGASRGMQASILLGAAVVVALAMMRQSMMLAERNRLLAAEYRLRESEGKFRTLFEMAEDAVFILDCTHFIDCNHSTLRLFGCSREEIIGTSPVDLSPEIQPDGKRSSEKAVQIMETVMGGTPQAFEWRMLRISDGTWFDAEVHINRIDLDGRALLGAIVRDITERKSAQEKARLDAERLHLAISAGKVGIWDLDLRTGKLDWDEQMFLLYGRSRTSENGPELWFDNIHPDDLAQAKAIHEDALRGEGKPFETNFRIFRQDDGSLRYMRAMGTVVHDSGGQPLRALGINWDVTEERLREEKLSQALKHEKELAEKARAGELAKSEFLAVMSHEIRTPMNGIMGFAELLAQSPSLPPECRDYVQIITTSSEALLRILDDILIFSRLEADHVEIEKTIFSPREMLEDIRALLAPSAQIKGLRFELEIEDSIPGQLLGDAGRLRQVLLNLAGNAIKFTEQGSVVLGMRRPLASANAESIQFFVRDTGVGIPAEKIRAIFQPFVQADYTISRRHGGAGLGLAISQRLTELMGGELLVKSEPGKGSLFTFIIPIDISPEGNRAAQPTDTVETLDTHFAASHPLRILLVEDDTVNRKLIGIVLSRLGYAPTVAHDGKEAVDIFRENRPDFILMDIQMPEMDGIEATRKIREIERTSSLPPAFIVAHTANISPDEKRRCLEAGMDHYLNKPFTPTQLAQALRIPSRARK